MTLLDEQKVLKQARSREWSQFWPLVLAALIGFAFYSVMINAIGLFVEPLSSEFGWSRTEIMFGIFLVSVIAIPLSPLIGALIDRFGSRRIALPGIVLSSLSIASLGLTTGSTVQWAVLWICQALVLLLIKTTVWTTAVATTFTAGRSLAIAVTMSGVALAQAVVPPLARWLIDEFGWRLAFVSLGLGWGLLAFVLALFFLSDARDRIRLSGVVESPAGLNMQGLSLQEASRNRPLIRIGLVTFVVMLMGVGISVNQVPILVEAGVSRESAAYFASLFGISGIAGKLVTGWLMDRFEPAFIGGITLGISAVAFALLLKPFHHPATMAVGLMVIGYASGTKLQICAHLTSVYAGLLNFGKVFGVMTSLIALGGGLGPTAAAMVFDTFGTYEPFIYVAIPITLWASSLLFRLGPKPKEFSAAASTTVVP